VRTHLESRRRHFISFLFKKKKSFNRRWLIDVSIKKNFKVKDLNEIRILIYIYFNILNFLNYFKLLG